MLNSLTRRACLAPLLFALCGLAGCKSNSYVPAKGKLVYADNDAPVVELADQDVTFSSEKLGLSARGRIQKDGSFVLGTMKDGDGLPPGEYIVTLTQPYRQPDRPYTGDRVVEVAYEDPAKSDLKAEVSADKPNDFTFKLRRIRKK